MFSNAEFETTRGRRTQNACLKLFRVGFSIYRLESVLLSRVNITLTAFTTTYAGTVTKEPNVITQNAHTHTPVVPAVTNI